MRVRATTRILVKGVEHQKDEEFDYEGPGHVCLIPVTGKLAAGKPVAPSKPVGGKKPPTDGAFE